jgi:hypothetical protein
VIRDGREEGPVARGAGGFMIFAFRLHLFCFFKIKFDDGSSMTDDGIT